MVAIPSQSFSIRVTSDQTVLGGIAAALAPGEWVDFPEGYNPLTGSYDIQWQTRWFYDPIRGEGQYMGKPASGQSKNHQHYIYDEASNTWRTTGQQLFPGTGHAWGYTYDYDTGDMFFQRWNDDHVRWMQHDTESWATTESNPNIVPGYPPVAGLGWHPNLFGVGDSGVVDWSRAAMAWRRADQSWYVISDPWPSGNPMRSRAGGTNVYVPALDTLVMFARRRDGESEAHTLVIRAGSDGALAPHELGAVPPLPVYGAGGDTNIGRPVLDPNDDGAILLLERNNPHRVWRSSDAGSSWSETGYHHPFGSMPKSSWIVTNVDSHGVVWALTSQGSPIESRSRLWRPHD